MKNNLNKVIYFDNAAALKPDPRVIDYFKKTVSNCYFNQEAIHSAAYDLRSKIENAEKSLINLFSDVKIGEFGVKKSNFKVLWGDSGTSVIHTYFSSPFFSLGNIVTTNLEHASISEGIKNSCNCELKFWQNSLKYNKNISITESLFDINCLKKLINNETKALVIHHVHSELGYIEDLRKIGVAVKEINPKTLVVVDAIQSVGKISMEKELLDSGYIDALTISGYKTGSFGGAAILYRDVDVDCFSSYFQKLRASKHVISRPNPVETLCLVKSLELLFDELEVNFNTIKSLRDYLYNELKCIKLFNGKKVEFLVNKDNCSPYILYFVLPGIQAAVILRMLAAENIYVSSGSACEAETNVVSKTLHSLNVPRDYYYGALRISFSSKTTLEEIKIFIDKLKISLENY